MALNLKGIGKALLDKLDRDKEREGFQIVPGGIRGGIQRVTSAPLSDYNFFANPVIKNRTERVKESFRTDPGQYSITRGFSNIVPLTKQALSPVKTFRGERPELDNSDSLKNNIAYGLRGATQVTPMQWVNALGIDKRGKANYQASTPQTEAQKKAQTIGRTLYSTALTAPIGGSNLLKNVTKRALTYGGVGGALGGAINKATGGSFTEGAKQGFISGVKSAPLLALTNPVTANLVGRVPQMGFLARQVAQRGVGAGANLIEDEILAKMDGYKRSNKDRVLSLAIGAVMTGNSEAYNKIKADLKKSGIKDADQLIKTVAERITPEDQFVLSFIDEKGEPSRIVMNKELARNWTGYLQSQGIEWKLNYIGKQGGFIQGDVGAPGANELGGKLKFEAPYKRGDIKTLETELDRILGTKEFQLSNKWQAKLKARETAMSQLEHYAKSGDEEAVKWFSKAKDLENQIINAQEARVAGKTGTKIKPEPEIKLDSALEELPVTKGTKIKDIKTEIPSTTEIVNQKGTKIIQKSGVAGKLPESLNMDQGDSLLTSSQPSRQVVRLAPQSQELDSKQLLAPQQAQSDKAKVTTTQKIDSSETIIADAKKQIGQPTKESSATLSQTIDKLKTQWIDRYYPIVKASETAKKELKTKMAELRPEHDPEYLVRRLTGAGGIADARYRRELEPIIKEIDSLGVDKSDLDVYLANNRMLGFDQAGREIYGVDPEKSRRVVTALEEKYPLIKQLAQKLYSYEDRGLSELAESGFFTKEQVSAMRSQNPNYAPLYRVMDDLDDYLGLPTRKTMQGTSPIKKIRGSDRQILSPLESIIGNTFTQRAAIEKNRVAQSIIGLQKIADMGFEKASKSGNDTITVWNNGQKEYWRVGVEIAETAKGVNEESMNLVLKMLQEPAGLLRQGATGRNPDFMIPNVFRDQLDAAIASKYGYVPFVDYARGLASMIKKDDIYRKWESSGAKIDLGELGGRKSISQMFDEKTTGKKLSDWIRGGFDILGDYSEQPTRIGLFKKAYKKTGNEMLSMMDSRDATVDFARMGSKMKVANSVIPFLNVGIQGFDKLIRSVKDNSGRVALALGTYAVLPQATTTIYNLLYHPEEYSEVPQYDKDSNFIIITGRNSEGTVNYIKIPKGNIVPIAANPTQSFIEFTFGQDQMSFGEMALSVLSSTIPVIGDGSSVKEIALKTIGDNIPQAIKPATEVLLNKSFFKYDDKKEESREIVPYYLKSKEPYQQFYEWTPSTYKAIGAALNVSPLQVQNIMEGYLAGFAKLPSQVVDIFNKTARGESVSQNDIPILRRFYSRTNLSSAPQKSSEQTKTPFMERITGGANTVGSTTSGVNVPTDQEEFNTLYKQALSNGSGFREKYNKIMFDPSLSESEKQVKVQEMKDEMQPWAELLIKMQDGHPEKIFEAEISTYKTGGGASVEKRGAWVKSQIDKMESEEDLVKLIDRLWDEKVLTSGKSGVAQYILDNYGIDVTKYTSAGKISGSGSGKVKTFKVSTPTISSGTSSTWKRMQSNSGTRILDLSRPRGQGAGTRIAGLRPNIRV